MVPTKKGPWAEVDRKLVSWHGLPIGSHISLAYDGHPIYGDRRTRSNIKVRRRLFRHKDHLRVEENPDLRVGGMLAEVRKMLLVDLDRRHMRLVAIAPRGIVLDPRTKVRSWREHDPEPGVDEREAARFRRIEIESELFPLARAAVTEIEELRSDPELTVPVAIVLALADRYGMSAVEDAITQARRWR